MERFQAIIQQIKAATDLVALIESYVPLRPAGRYFKGLCPFHQEKTPSFTVYPDSQHYKCYGCGAWGDAFKFLQERDGLTFREAVETLAQRTGVSIEGMFGAQREPRRRGPDPHAVLALVRDYFAAALRQPAGEVVRGYLERRGLAAAIEPFGLGAHPARPGVFGQFAKAQKLPLDVLEQAGLLRAGREPFAGRLMFPIEDARGRVIGFGGRAMDDARAKYINSPESPFFLKRQTLYGLPLVKRAGERQIVVVEGYTDVIACHLAGFQGAVATLGTALTPAHGEILRRYANGGVVLLFDGDRAGRAAAEKAYPELVKTELEVRIGLVGDGADPADLLSARPGRDAGEIDAARTSFAELLAGAEDALQMWFRLKRLRLDLRQEVHVAAVVEDCKQVLAGIDDRMRRTLLLGRMAQQLGIDEATLRRSIGSLKPRVATATTSTGAVAAVGGDAAGGEAEPATPLLGADQDLLACVLAAPPLAPMAAAEHELAAPVERLVAAADTAVQGGADDTNALLRILFAHCAEDPESGKILAVCADLARSLQEPEEAFDLVCRQRRAFLARRNAQQLRFELQQARAEGNHDRVQELTRRYVEELRAREVSPP